MTTFADALIALGQHMKLCPDLPDVGNLSWRFYYVNEYKNGLQIQLHRTTTASLAAWAHTFTEVASEVRRYKEGEVHAFVTGRMADVDVLVWARVDEDGFPDEPGTHEWDVTTLLQEA